MRVLACLVYATLRALAGDTLGAMNRVFLDWLRRALVSSLALACAGALAQPLPHLNADIRSFTVSGLSSGAYMAVQLAVAHSARVSGVGVFAGGPYYCAAGSVIRALGDCMKGSPAAADAVSHARRFAAAGSIDDVRHLARTRAWLLAGAKDEVVAVAVVKAANEFFATFNADGVAFRVQPELGHGLPTVGHGSQCHVSEPPFLANCGEPAVGNMLAHISPTSGASNATPMVAGRLLRFEQTEFVPYWRRLAAGASFDSHGYVYVPQRCLRESCRVHVALHGCRQGAAAVGEAFVRNAGYNAWAEHANAIVLYPQIRPTEPTFFAWWLPTNPRGCWDWWGYTGADYATQRGLQIRTMMTMVERLGAAR